ncbi:DUF6479 family protein [Streptomyces endophyticus]|uniref:DUF6479 family protein n=1 Tax=Streptomyces endophyticus TaxID=714166 RepID=A0ABU6FG61_9ACTN|nr:DUF6479 family protein [Streptomyces endophyticus]MEB8343028.1 DUF6479 family protein [Streptomyces endophyticus]
MTTLTTLTTPMAVPDPSTSVVPFVVGLVIALALIWAVWMGIRFRRREPGPPDPADQPKLPRAGPVHEVSEMREPDEMPHTDDGGSRLTPHELHGFGNAGSRRSEDQRPRRWGRGDRA